MYAVIETGGKQYRVSPGDVIEIERPSDRDNSEDFTFDRVLMVGGENVMIGTPVVEGASVSATAVAETRGPKIVVFKKKRRKQYRRTNGHRQDLLRVRIGDIHV